MKKFLKAIWKYLKDWKNLLGHALVGVAIILVAAYMPIPWWGRILVLIAIILFNIFREKIFKKIFGERDNNTT
jgi:small-conductance mechanosensitive channel